MLFVFKSSFAACCNSARRGLRLGGNSEVVTGVVAGGTLGSGMLGVDGPVGTLGSGVASVWSCCGTLGGGAAGIMIDGFDLDGAMVCSFELNKLASCVSV